MGERPSQRMAGADPVTTWRCWICRRWITGTSTTLANHHQTIHERHRLCAALSAEPPKGTSPADSATATTNA
jgi:hypothetical protein